MKGPTFSKFDKILVVVVIIGLTIFFFWRLNNRIKKTEAQTQLIINVLSFNIQQGRILNLPQQPPAKKPEEKPKEKK